MVVKLHTMDGKTRVYETHQGEGSGEYGPDKYVTKCGMEWKRKPKPYETCDHIDCALDIQRRATGGPVGFLLCSAIGIIFFFILIRKDGGIWAFAAAGFYILIGIESLISGSKAEDKVNELTEYKSKGTINGTRAYIVSASEELNELRSAKECIGYGLALYGTGKYDDAIKAFDKAIELDSNSAAAWNNKGLTFKAQNKRDEAITAYDKATKIDPQLAEAWYKKGLILGNLGKYDEAIQAYNEAIEINPKDVDVWYNKGMALRLLGRITEADATFAHAKRGLNSNGMGLFYLGRYDEAIKAYDMALTADPKYVDAWINKGTALFKLGRYSEAIRAFNQVIEMGPQHADAWNRKGVVLKKMGLKVEAEDAFAKAKELGYVE